MRRQTFDKARHSNFSPHQRVPARSSLHLTLLSTILALGSVFALIGASARANALETRSCLDLNGVWDFRLDPKAEGVAQSWFNADVSYPDKIKVPGNWQAQGFGEPWRHIRHNYQGKAWYRRTVTVPAAWKGRRIWIVLGGVTATADVYVNGLAVGSVDGYLTPYEFDITDALRPEAANVIACRVDSTGVMPVATFNFICRWGGLYRDVRLEARPDIAIEDLFVMPDVKNSTARSHVVLRRASAGGDWEGQLTLQVTPVTGGPACQGEGPVRFKAGSLESDAAMVDVKVNAMHPWSPEDPFLYSVQATLSSGGKVVDSIRDRFGMRQFEVTKDGALLLNGRPIFVRGIGDDNVEVIHGTPIPDKKVHLDRINQAKRYGFNGTRFLGLTPIKEYFDAADELGFLVMAEGAVYWKPKEAIPVLKKQVTRLAKAYRNHPSWYIWSAGNEFFECQGVSPEPDWMDYILYAHETFKKLDPTRFFVASDGADVFPTDIITQAAKFSPTPPSPAQPFHGLVDDVAYFRTALPEADLARLAESRATVAEKVKSLRPSGHWQLKEKAPGNGVSLKPVAKTAFAAGNDPFSISIWAKPEGFAKDDFGTPFAYGAAANGRAILVSMDGSGGDGKIILGRWWDNFLTSKTSLTRNEWNHIGITYDGKTIKLFLNGKLDSTREIRLGTEVRDGCIGNIVSEPGAQEDYQSRPHIWHEFPNSYVMTLPDLTIDAKWTGVFRDDNTISLHRKQIANLGLTDRYPEIRQRSIDYFYLYLKQVYEAARHSKTMDGYGYWLGTDWPGAGEGDMNFLGIFSSVYEPEKFPNPAPILQFNRETVLLINADSSQRVLLAGERKNVVVTVSHYGVEPIENGRITWEVKSGKRVLQQGKIEPVRMKLGEVSDVGTIEMGPCQPDQAEHLQLFVKLDSSSCQQDNQWDFWVFPPNKRDFAGSKILNLTAEKMLDERYGGPKLALGEAQVILANRLTKDIMDWVGRGGKVVLLAEEKSFAKPRHFRYWHEWIRPKGTLVERHPAVAGFPHDGFCSFQFYRMFGDGLQVPDMTDKGRIEREKMSPIVWGMDGDTDPSTGLSWSHPDNRWKLYRSGIIAEGRIGQGRFISCSLRVLSGIRNQLPEAGYLLDCLVDYALSTQFAPNCEPMTREEVPQVFSVQ